MCVYAYQSMCNHTYMYIIFSELRHAGFPDLMPKMDITRNQLKWLRADFNQRYIFGINKRIQCELDLFSVCINMIAHLKECEM